MDDGGIAITSEYVVLLGISLLVFAAVAIGASSFARTASADARAAAAYAVAARVGEGMAAAAEGPASASVDVELPERICGRSYIVFPSRGGASVCVLVGADAYEAPLIVPEDVDPGGLMVSVAGPHRIVFESSSRALTIS